MNKEKAIYTFNEIMQGKVGDFIRIRYETRSEGESIRLMLNKEKNKLYKKFPFLAIQVEIHSKVINEDTFITIEKVDAIAEAKRSEIYKGNKLSGEIHKWIPENVYDQYRRLIINWRLENFNNNDFNVFAKDIGLYDTENNEEKIIIFKRLFSEIVNLTKEIKSQQELKPPITRSVTKTSDEVYENENFEDDKLIELDKKWRKQVRIYLNENPEDDLGNVLNHFENPDMMKEDIEYIRLLYNDLASK